MSESILLEILSQDEEYRCKQHKAFIETLADLGISDDLYSIAKFMSWCHSASKELRDWHKFLLSGEDCVWNYLDSSEGKV